MRAIKGIITLFILAGCATADVDQDGNARYHNSFYTGSPKEIAEAGDQRSRTKERERNADEDAASARKIEEARAAAEVKKMEAEAQYIQAYAERLSPATGQRLKELLELRKELYTERQNTRVDSARWEDLTQELDGTRQLIHEFTHETDGGPISMGGLPFMTTGLGFGQPISMGNDPTKGRVVNETNDTIRLTINGAESWIQPQGAIAMNLAPGTYRYAAQRFVTTAMGIIAGATIGDDLPVNDRWEESIGQGWELRFRPWTFPSQ